ncbi:unnamed protein product [Polarella glacialis]|uniref:5'-nucleotidase n=1 Tax=Polarella glacialis TaxID=89957 RepID=A0A813IPP3_POLGL|nr:unnamed protein product [Polarella glacialis]
MARPYCRLIALLLAGVAAAPLNLTILHMNDHHSHLSGETISLKQTSSMNVTGVKDIKITLGGFPRIVTAYNRLKAEAEVAGRTVLKLHAGDALTGTSFYTLFKGEADAKMMAMVCFDAFALGNHEFDDGDSALAGFIQKLKTSNSSCPNTAVLAANVVPGASSPLIGKIQKSTTLTVNGEQIGIIGIDIMGKTMMSSSPSAGTILTDEKAAAQTEINTLLAAGVNKIILLTHIGYDLDQEWIAGLSGVDAVVGADSHTLLGDSSTTTAGLSIGGLYPTVMTNGDGKKVCVTTAWEYTKAIGNLEIDFDANGDVLSCGGSPKFPYDGTSMVADSALSADDLTLVNNHLNSLGGQFIATAQDSATLTLLTNYSGQVDALKKLKIADVPVTLCYDRFPGEGRSTACPKNATEKQGGAACQLVAQAFLYVSKTADFAIQNGGGCRSDIVAGNLSYNGAITMLPFANLIVTLKMTGAQVKQVLEEALDYGLSAGGSSGAYPYASGLRFDVNCNMSKGSRFSNMEVNSRLTGTWTAIDPLKNYTLGTNSYTAAGKDGYVSFASVQASLVNLQIDYAEGLVTYAKAVGTLTIPPLSDWSTQAYTNKVGVSFGAGARTASPTEGTPAPTTAPTSSPTASNTTSPQGSVTVTKVVGTMAMEVANCTAFTGMPGVEGAVAAGFASAIGVAASSVKVTLSCPSRRLASGLLARRLADAVNAAYEITIPAGSTTITAASVTSVIVSAGATGLTSAIATIMTAANIVGVNLKVTSVSRPETKIFVSTPSTTLSTTSSASISTSTPNSSSGTESKSSSGAESRLSSTWISQLIAVCLGIMGSQAVAC